MKRVFLFWVGLLFLGAVCVSASEGGYRIESFYSDIEIKKDGEMAVTERIMVEFSEERHGIYRLIPVEYESGEERTKIEVKVRGVSDGEGKKVEYRTQRRGDYLEIRIGDENKTVKGDVVYVIEYSALRALRQYEDHDELYWNVTGSEWDTMIGKGVARVKLPNVGVERVACFAGVAGSEEKDCVATKTGDYTAEFVSTTDLGSGRDMTIVVGFEKGMVDFPGRTEGLLGKWWYLFSVVPFGAILWAWYKKGRDRRYVEDNIYYEPDDKRQRTVSVFERKLLPLVYYPINSLTPAEAGILVDERADISDVVAEMVELARLGYIKIHKFEKKDLLGKKDKYAFEQLKEGTGSELRGYQKLLLEEIFRGTIVEKTKKAGEKEFGIDGAKRKYLVKKAQEGKVVLLDEMKSTFYTGLKEIKESMYKRMADEGLFDGDPEKVRIKWVVIAMLLAGVSIMGIIVFGAGGGGLLPGILWGILLVPTGVMAFNMPRRSARGYSLYLQVRGLKWYLEKGKWRHEIAEKQLFLEEMLPLAICLGVVGKLTREMEKIGVKPPSYFDGVNSASLYSGINSFNTVAKGAALSGAGKGGSGWSGGSGFSGGSSGGGFGGGGGGSW